MLFVDSENKIKETQGLDSEPFLSLIKKKYLWNISFKFIYLKNNKIFYIKATKSEIPYEKRVTQDRFKNYQVNVGIRQPKYVIHQNDTTRKQNINRKDLESLHSRSLRQLPIRSQNIDLSEYLASIKLNDSKIGDQQLIKVNEMRCAFCENNQESKEVYFRLLLKKLRFFPFSSKL